MRKVWRSLQALLMRYFVEIRLAFGALGRGKNPVFSHFFAQCFGNIKKKL